MRRYRSLIRRLLRNAPPERVKIRVTWLDGETTIIDGYRIPGYDMESRKTEGRENVPSKPAPPNPAPAAPKGKPNSYNGDR